MRERERESFRFEKKSKYGLMGRCWHGAECEWLAQRRCLFLRTAQEQRETCRLKRRLKTLFGGKRRSGRRFVCSATPLFRLAGSMMWERGAVRAGFAPAPRTAVQVEELAVSASTNSQLW